MYEQRKNSGVDVCVGGGRRTYSESFTITRDIVREFARLSGDFSPIHMDETYAQNTRFGKCIVHGMLLGAYVSKIIGMYLPGEGTIYISQNFEFKKPVYIGDSVLIEVSIVDINYQTKHVKLSTMCYGADDDSVIMKGEAVVLLPG